MAELETIEIDSGPDASAVVIWLHGLGADAHDFESVVPLLDLGPDCPVRYIFPNAPVQPVTINGGLPMRSWYDIVSFERDAEQDEKGIRASAALVERLIARELECGIAADRIVLAGFSQGGSVALFTALRYTAALAGVMALSTYLPISESVVAEIHAADRKLPIFMAHGEMDNVVPITLSRNSRGKLHQLGYQVLWREYPIVHTVSPEELLDIKSFLSQVFSA